jgi:hypothetical protein
LYAEIKEDSRRTLILISKIVQNTVNGLQFKEPYLKSMNGFIVENSEKIVIFMKKLGV